MKTNLTSPSLDWKHVIRLRVESDEPVYTYKGENMKWFVRHSIKRESDEPVYTYKGENMKWFVRHSIKRGSF